MAFKDPLKPIIARLFATNTPPNERIEIDSYRNEGPNTGSQIRFYKNGEQEFKAAKILLSTEGLDPDFYSVFEIKGSDHTASGIPAEIAIYDKTDGTNYMVLASTGSVQIQNGLALQPIAKYDNLVDGPDTWKAIPLAGTWIDFAGQRAQYFMDGVGRVQFRGRVQGGGGPGIANIPAGYWPTQQMEWVMRGVGGVVLCAVSVSTAGVVTATANAATAQASGILLDSISYPTR